ncbi:flagellar assembly protein FlaJ [Desulfurococcaceae archaeon AG1]|jgi:flagellar protein FlaJ|nr:MAG: hypothetical protein DJ555_01965 [Desulfurococcaceae archaeon]GAY26472.1 flagellar assembly protein FlaJ [Desulfurococcaceae archaeon AG1]
MLARLKPRLDILRVFRAGMDTEDLFLLVHLYALISSGIERKEAIDLISREEKIYRKTSKILRFVSILTKKWGYDTIFTLVTASKRVRKAFIKDFLERLSQIVGSGADLVLFLRNEIESSLITYVNQFDKIFEAARVLFSLFSTFMSASVFMLSNMVIIAMLLGGGDYLAIVSTIGLLLSLVALGIVVITMMPRDPIAVNGSKNDKTINRYALLSILLGLSLFTIAYTIYPYMMILPILMLSLPMIFMGRLILRIEAKLMRYDEMFPVFTRSLGHILSVIPDMGQGIKVIMRGSLGILEPNIVLLKRRLSLRIQLERAWNMMLDEIGSRICLFSGKVMLQTFLYQGDVKGIGKMLGDIMSSINDLRKKRIQIAKAFESTLLMLHLLVSAILGLISSLVSLFSYILGLTEQRIISITPISNETVFIINMITIITVAIINGLVARASYPGSIKGAVYHIGIMLALGWIVYTVSNNTLIAIIENMLGELKIPVTP